jgi:hypothetical protein
MLSAVRQFLDTRTAVALINSATLESMNDCWIANVRAKWSNGGYAARQSYVRALVDHALQLNRGDNVLDVGSGLSTLILKRICEVKGAHLYALEHDADWCKRMRKLAGDCVRFAPLKSYGEFDWYTVPPEVQDISFQLVCVDGPPEKATRGSRSGLLHVMSRNLASATILVDDYRPTKPWVIDWQEKLGAQFNLIGELTALVRL